MANETETPDKAVNADARIAELEKKLSRLRRKLKAKRGKLKAIKPAKISPLAPEGGFPVLPLIEGVRFGAAMAGVKSADRLDVMLAEIAPGSSIAGVFTKSATRSAPVLDCQAKLAVPLDNSKGFAILVNSGNSNAFTGRAGDGSVKAICQTTAKAMNIPEANVFTASTGVIGQPLPHDKITNVINDLQADLDVSHSERAALAIMTTDTFPKAASAEFVVDGKTVTIAGFAKGSGMIAPDMATMLVYIFTDALIDQPDLQRIVSRQNKTTFNAITVDSDTSTSDTLMVAATGKSGVKIAGPASKTGRAFAAALGQVMRELAHLVIKDGEGATKFVEVNVSGATSKPAATKVAMAIANSPLVKTAIAGEDPNWGRIVMAVGKSGAKADRDLLRISFGDILVAENGWVSPDYTEEQGAAYMKNPELQINVDLGLGKGQATVWTCDLTKQYITINADYRS